MLLKPVGETLRTGGPTTGSFNVPRVSSCNLGHNNFHEEKQSNWGEYIEPKEKEKEGYLPNCYHCPQLNLLIFPLGTDSSSLLDLNSEAYMLSEASS